MTVPAKTLAQFSVATANGRGAVATIVIVGDGAEDCVNQLFRAANGSPISADRYNDIIYGRWINNGCLGEDLVVCPINSSHIEIHCHGGDLAARTLSQSLIAIGAIESNQAEIAQWIHGSRYAADLRMTLASAPTQKTARIILRQQQIQESFWNRLRELIVEENRATTIPLLDDCLVWKQFGRRLTEPCSVVLCGSPNVGKSSLINAMLGYRRAIVHPVAGTTRDVVDSNTAFDGWPVRLSDTAGIRESENEIERLGISRAYDTIESADLVVRVVDGQSTEFELQQASGAVAPDLIVGNKCDLEPTYDVPADVQVSAKTGQGIEKLIEEISKRLVRDQPGPNQIFPVSQYQNELFGTLRHCIEQGDWHAANKTVSDICFENPA